MTIEPQRSNEFGTSVSTTEHSTTTKSARALEADLIFEAIDAARFGVCVIAPDERVLTMTPAFAQKLGVEAAAALGRNARNLLTDKLSIAGFGQLIGINEPETSVELPLTCSDGRVAVLLVQGRTSRSPERGMFRVLSVIEVADFGITPTRMQDLRRQLEAINSALVISDFRHPDMPIMFVNDRFRVLTGYGPEEVIGRNCRFLQGDDNQQEALLPLRQAIAAGRGGYALLRNYRRNGEMFLNELLVTPIRDGTGAVTHMVGLQREQSARY